MVEFTSVMNILFMSRLFYPHIGGVEKHVLEVSKLLIILCYIITLPKIYEISKDFHAAPETVLNYTILVQWIILCLYLLWNIIGFLYKKEIIQTLYWNIYRVLDYEIKI